MKIYSNGGSIEKLRKTERDFNRVRGCKGDKWRERLKEREEEGDRYIKRNRGRNRDRGRGKSRETERERGEDE